MTDLETFHIGCAGTSDRLLCRDGWLFRVCQHPKCEGIPHRESVCLCSCHTAGTTDQGALEQLTADLQTTPLSIN